jgi:hypothetical protein
MNAFTAIATENEILIFQSIKAALINPVDNLRYE